MKTKIRKSKKQKPPKISYQFVKSEDAEKGMARAYDILFTKTMESDEWKKHVDSRISKPPKI
jgi:hypothetical protein